MAAELASGYISLSVKYADGMKQITNDLLGLDKTAKKAGTDAGQSLATNLTKASKIDASDAKKTFTGFESAAEASGTKTGRQLGEGILSGARQKVSAGASKITDGIGSSGKDAASNFVEGFGGPIAAIGTKGGPIGLALSAAVGLSIGAGVAIGKNIMAGLDREVKSDLVQARLGIDDATMARFGQINGKVYANNFGESRDQVMEAMQASFQGKLFDSADTDAEIQATTEKVIGLTDVIGGDMTQTVKAVSSLIKNGLAKDADEALDVITQGYLKNGDLGDDLLDSISEYGAGWKNTGLNAAQAMALISQATANGSDTTDRPADALREYGRRINEEGPKIVEMLDEIGLNGEDTFKKLASGDFQSFDKVVDTIRAIEDPIARDNALMTLFGDTAGDFIDVFAKWDPSEAVNKFGQVEGAADGVLGTMGNNAAGTIEGTMRSIEVAMDGMQDSLASVFGPELQKIAEWVKANGPAIEGFFLRVTQVAISAVGSVVDFAGDFMIALGQLSGGIGNVLGGILKAGSALQRLTGDDETADQWAAEAEAMFGWGEGLVENGEKLKSYNDDLGAVNDRLAENEAKAKNAQINNDLLANSIETLPDGKTVTLKDNSEEVRKKVEDLGYTVQELPDGKLTIRVDYKDSDGKVIPPDQLKGYNPNEYDSAGDAQRARRGYAHGGVVRGPGTGTSDSILAWLSNGEGVVTADGMSNGGGAIVTALNAGWVPPADFLHRMIPGFAEGLNPGADFLRSQIMQLWPKITTIGGKRSEDGYGEHSSGNAIDVMIPGYDTPQGKALGDAVASWVVANKEALGLDGMIWRQTSFGYGGSWSGKEMGDRGSDTQNHMDHLHLILGEGRGEGAPAVDLPSMSLSSPSGGTLSPGGGGSGGGSKATAKQMSAQQDKITDLESKLATSELALSEVEDDAPESTKKSKRDARDKNQRELEQAKQELADMQNGTGDYAGDSTSGGTDSNNPYLKIMEGLQSIIGDTPGQLADTALSGLKDSFLPPGFEDPQQWPMVQSLSSVMQFIGGLVGGVPGLGPLGSILGGVGAGIGGDASGMTNSFMSLLPAPFGDAEANWGPNDFAAVDQQHQGSGALPGPANYTPDPAASGPVHNDNSIHVAEGGQINQNATQILDKTQRQQNANQRPYLGTRRYI